MKIIKGKRTTDQEREYFLQWIENEEKNRLNFCLFTGKTNKFKGAGKMTRADSYRLIAEYINSENGKRGVESNWNQKMVSK